MAVRSGGATAVMVLVVLLVGADASAQPPGETRQTPARRDRAERKSPALALGLGLGFTAGGAALLAVDAAGEPDLGALGVVSMYIGPSIGRWYGGGSAAIGLIARAGAVAVLISGIDDRPPDLCVPDVQTGDTCEGYYDAKADFDRREKTRFIVAGTLWFGSTIYDFVMAPLDAREHNREHGIAVVPTVTPGGAGLAINGSF